ncbi:hypothetical protein [Streptomyces sp. BE133]|uniref:hypothetical protein n=1 Tax=Streptomyces sp. BE133 TaxID=3002523 RepID=UPI002E78FBFB|nr:hypothetical protein [Streptomyces sp. BE133]
MELVFDEFKTHQRGRLVLRSQTPNGVRQEIYAHLIVHHATRALLDEAARLHQSIAERTSFPGPARHPPHGHAGHGCPGPRRLRGGMADVGPGGRHCDGACSEAPNP